MKAAVIVFPGSNCDRDVAVALRRSMTRDPEMVWHGDSALPKVDLIVLPGGFSYGDYLRSGAMAAQSPIIREVVARAKDGFPVLGICNGFQILVETGLLPGALLRNSDLRFVCRDVWLQVENRQTIFTSSYATSIPLRIPVAHHDGNYYADEPTLDRLEETDAVAFRYCRGPDGPDEADGAANPNGSARDIAGIFNDQKNILGMMPHPERLADAALGGTDGQPLFDSLVSALAG